MRAAPGLLLLWTSWTLLGCGDEVEGNLRILLTYPHSGRNGRDPFTVGMSTEFGIVQADGSLKRIGSFGATEPVWVEPSGTGFPYLLGVVGREPPRAHGFGCEEIMLQRGMSQTTVIPFSTRDMLIATKVPAVVDVVPVLADRFSKVPPALVLDRRFQDPEQTAISVSAVATALWHDQTLMLQVKVIDDTKYERESDNLDSQDAVQIAWQEEGGKARTVTVTPNKMKCQACESGICLPCETSVAIPGISGSRLEASGNETYFVRMVIPLAASSKNSGLDFNLRIFDRDGGGSTSTFAWCGGEEYGKLVLSVPVLQLLVGKQTTKPAIEFPVAGLKAKVSGTWNDLGMVLDVVIPPKIATNRLEFLFDLNNGVTQPTSDRRFVSIAATPGGGKSSAAGRSLADVLAMDGQFSNGVVNWADKADGSKEVSAALQWSDVDAAFTVGSQPGSGMFLGAEIRVIDASGAAVGTWSDIPVLDLDQNPSPEMYWPELRLFRE